MIYKLDKEKISKIGDIHRGEEYRAAIKDFLNFFTAITKTEITKPILDSLPKEFQELFTELTPEELENSKLFILAKGAAEAKND